MNTDALGSKRPWERRLADLAQILRNCEQTYFDPNTFRINTNNFLQTARTVTFIMQKNKKSIVDFDAWYSATVLTPWASDSVMIWARDSRNAIEKEGDLELHSSLAVTLIFSYRDEEDIAIPCGRGELVSSVKRLMRFARRRLPSGVSDVSVLKLERKWVANSLPDWELLHALTYVYARIHAACTDLACSMSPDQSLSAPESTTFDSLLSDARKTRYFRLNDTEPRKLGAVRLEKDPEFVPAPSIKALIDENKVGQVPRTLDENVAFHSRFAQATFEHFGNHVPMLMLFDEHTRCVDFSTAQFPDQATKYLFWRSIADRILYLRPASLIWIGESWLRDGPYSPEKLIRNMPITGEMLGVHGMDASGRVVEVLWRIVRDADGRNPRLERLENQGNMAMPNYFIPALRAFEKIRSISST